LSQSQTSRPACTSNARLSNVSSPISGPSRHWKNGLRRSLIPCRSSAAMACIIRVTATDLRYKSHRAVVARDLTSPSLLTFPLVGSDLTVGVPRATGLLEARGRYQFFHGGASLQEIVVPHLCATFPRRTVKFDVRLHTPSRITSLLFDVELEAIPPSGQYSLGGQISARYVEVRVYLIHDGQVESSPLATAAGPHYFVSEAQMGQRVRLRMSDTARFRYSDPVRIVVDADAPGVQLDQADATLHVEPEV
jgi:hypothetical protein